jgi:hypothetical protein
MVITARRDGTMGDDDDDDDNNNNNEDDLKKSSIDGKQYLDYL